MSGNHQTDPLYSWKLWPVAQTKPQRTHVYSGDEAQAIRQRIRVEDDLAERREIAAATREPWE